MNHRSKEERILIKALIIAFGATIIVLFGSPIWAEDIPTWVRILGIIPFYGLPILIVLYLLAVAKRYLDSKIPDSRTAMDIHARIIVLNESMERIEKKVDKIDRILEKVSE